MYVIFSLSTYFHKAVRTALFNCYVFSSRWTCIGWPHKIQLQMEATEANLEADEERFQKNLLADQNTFQDRLDSLNMAVAGFAAHTDLSKSHEVANEVRRLTKQLKECQTLATTYNNRERLFGLPVTSVSHGSLVCLFSVLHTTMFPGS